MYSNIHAAKKIPIDFNYCIFSFLRLLLKYRKTELSNVLSQISSLVNHEIPQTQWVFNNYTYTLTYTV